jgi:hypothetical protein
MAILNLFVTAAHEPSCEGAEVMSDLLVAYDARRRGEPPEVYRRIVCRSCLENVSVLLSTASSDIAAIRPR